MFLHMILPHPMIYLSKVSMQEGRLELTAGAHDCFGVSGVVTWIDSVGTAFGGKVAEKVIHLQSAANKCQYQHYVGAAWGHMWKVEKGLQ